MKEFLYLLLVWVGAWTSLVWLVRFWTAFWFRGLKAIRKARLYLFPVGVKWYEE